MADPKDKKIATLAAKVEELQSILPPVNEIKAQLEERKAACRALKTQVDRAKEENKRLSKRVGELEGKQGVSAGGGSATVKGLRLQLLKLEKEKRVLQMEVADAGSERGAAAATAEDEMRRLRAIIEGQKDDHARLERQIADLKEEHTATVSTAEDAINRAREEAEAALAAAEGAAWAGAGAGAAGGPFSTEGSEGGEGTEQEEGSAPPLPPGTPRDAAANPSAPATPRQGGSLRSGVSLRSVGGPGGPGTGAGGGSLQGRIQQLEMECAAAEAAAVEMEKAMTKNSAIDRRAGVREGTRRYAVKPALDAPVGVPGDDGWTSLLVDKSGAVIRLPDDVDDEDKDMVHCGETDFCLELTLERAEVMTGKGGGGERFRVHVDASPAAASGSHEPIALSRVATAMSGGSLVNISAQVHVVVPVTRHNLRNLLTQPLRVELHILSSSAAAANDGETGDGGDDHPPPPPDGNGDGGNGGGGDVEDVMVGLVPLGDMLRDEYPEAFGATGLVGPVRGAMYGVPAPAPYQITLLRPAADDAAEEEQGVGGGGVSGGGVGGGGGGGEGALVGHVTVRARFRRSAAAVLSLFNGVNDALDTFEGNPHALAAAKGEEPLVVMLAWGSARVQDALGVAHKSVGRLLRNILEDGVVDAEEMSALEAMLGLMEKDVGAAVKVGAERCKA